MTYVLFGLEHKRDFIVHNDVYYDAQYNKYFLLIPDRRHQNGTGPYQARHTFKYLIVACS